MSTSARKVWDDIRLNTDNPGVLFIIDTGNAVITEMEAENVKLEKRLTDTEGAYAAIRDTLALRDADLAELVQVGPMGDAVTPEVRPCDAAFGNRLPEGSK